MVDFLAVDKLHFLEISRPQLVTRPGCKNTHCAISKYTQGVVAFEYKKKQYHIVIDNFILL